MSAGGLLWADCCRGADDPPLLRTELPALSAFCVFASVGVLAIYCYMLTFFCACLTIDEKRQAANRRDCCPCIVLEGEQPAGARSAKLRAFIR